MEEKQKTTPMSSALKRMLYAQGQKQNVFEDKSEVKINPLVFRKMWEAEIRQKWKQVVGEFFASKTTSIRLINKLLMVSIDSASIRNELQFNRTAVIRRMNEELGKQAIADLIIR